MQIVTINENQLAVKKSENLLADYIRENRNPEWLVKFCKAFPAACFIPWVQGEFGRLVALKLSTFSDLDLSIFENGQGQGKTDAGLSQLVIDCHIYMDVKKLVAKGYHLKDKDREFSTSAFTKLQGMKNLSWKKFFSEKNSKKKKKYPISASQIAFRYYRFKRFWEGSKKRTKDDYTFQRVDFIDNGMLICGPGKFDMGEKIGFGFCFIDLKTLEAENLMLFEVQ